MIRTGRLFHFRKMNYKGIIMPLEGIVTENHCSMEDCSKTGIENFQEKYHCKITVLKKMFNEDLYRQYPYGWPYPCGRLEEGQEFVTNYRWDCPEGFCSWAWRDLLPSIHSIHGGSQFVAIGSCTDGLRPVLFKLERVDAE